MPQSFLLQIPATGENDAKQYFMKELRLLKEFLEKLSGKAITNERLRHAIEVYNENRSLMKQLYELRKRPDFAMPGRNVIDIIRAGLVIPKDSHNDILNRLIEGYNYHTKHHGEEKALRLYILSNTLEETDSIIQLIEELGGEVISDNFCFGLRYCWEPVILGSDPMVSLADHYLEKIPIPGKYPMNLIADQLTDMVKTSEADGAIYVVERFCDPYLFEYPILLESMKEKGIQILNVEAEEAGNLQRLRTKLEAFMEVLQSEIV